MLLTVKAMPAIITKLLIHLVNPINCLWEYILVRPNNDADIRRFESGG